MTRFSTDKFVLQAHDPTFGGYVDLESGASLDVLIASGEALIKRKPAFSYRILNEYSVIVKSGGKV